MPCSAVFTPRAHISRAQWSSRGQTGESGSAMCCCIHTSREQRQSRAATICDMLSMFKNSLMPDGCSPVSKYFVLGRQTGSAGPEMVWKIYEAHRIKDNKEVSVFIFEKKIADKLHKPGRREKVAEILRREVSNLNRLKHPKILKLVHGLEENNDSLAFASEPVIGSLANLLGNHDRLPTPLPDCLKDYSFQEIEIKYGILQISEALAHLHSTESLVHCNLCPSSIIVTKRRFWKIAGLGFCEKPKKDGKPDAFTCSPWSNKQSKMAQPDLDYMAPEIQMPPDNGMSGNTCTPYCDMFSLGQTLCAVYNHGKSLLQAGHSTATYAKRLEQMTELFGEVAHKMPLQLVEPVEKMINRDIRYRPSAQSFMMLRYFDDPVARCMQCLDAMESRDLSVKCDFFVKLAPTIHQFPKGLLYTSVFPLLVEQLAHSDMLVLALPSLLNVVQASSQDEYKTVIQPEIKHIFTMQRPVQATVYLLEKLDVLMSKASEEEVKSVLLPMIFSTLEGNSIPGQEAAISVFSTIRKYLDDQTLKKLVLPKAKGLFHKSTNIRTRLNALACIERLIDSLEKMMIIEEVLPFLTDITCQDVDIIMAIMGIYRHMLEDKKFGLTHNLLACKVMPTLIPLTVAPGLNLDQFTEVMLVLREMLDQIECQRRTKMINESPDMNALQMRRSSLQQMYYLASASARSNSIRLPEEYLAMARFNKRPSFGSNSSIGSAYSVLSGHSLTGRVLPGSVRRTSIDMRGVPLSSNPDSPKHDGRYLLTVDEALKYRPPSTPELQTRLGSNESLGPRAYRRHSSFQGLGCEEQAVLDKIVRDRRASLAPGNQSIKMGPHILVSEPSVQNFDDHFLYPLRRASTQSMGPVVVPEPGRRDSKGRLIDFPNTPRRSSFQGICESAMAFFVSGK